MAIRRFKLDYISNIIMEQDRQSPNCRFDGSYSILSRRVHAGQTNRRSPCAHNHIINNCSDLSPVKFGTRTEQKPSVIRASALIYIYRSVTGPSYVHVCAIHCRQWPHPQLANVGGKHQLPTTYPLHRAEPTGLDNAPSLDVT